MAKENKKMKTIKIITPESGIAPKWENKKNKKVSYNPFKMWGSWVGVMLLFILALEFAPLLALHTVSGVCPYGDGESCAMWRSGALGSNIWGYDAEVNIAALKFILLSIPVGFLIGWAIHSLCRGIKNNTKN
jgi:hypothetical protein